MTEYCIQHQLLNERGFKQFKDFVPEDVANKLLPKFSITDKAKHFFHTAHHAANKAINPDTGKLSEYPVLLKSSDGVH